MLSIERKLQLMASNYWSEWSPEMRAIFDHISPFVRPLFNDNYYQFLMQGPEKAPAIYSRMLKLCEESDFAGLVNRAWEVFSNYVQPVTTPVLEQYPELEGKCVAYFSMEYGFHTLPIYSGGLGILSGDHLRGSSDLGLPLVGVGLFYRQGYYRQCIDSEGHMKVFYDSLIPAKKSIQNTVPIEALTEPGKDAPLIVPVLVAERTVKLQVWRLRVGRVDLLLLDSNIPENSIRDRYITQRLYASKKNHQEERRRRIEQEIILGVGGVKALFSAGYLPEAFHINEGHASLASAEILAHTQRLRRCNFNEAMKVVIKKIGFTTHTPVPEGNERFDIDLVKHHMLPYLQTFLSEADAVQFLELGRNSHNQFDMTQFALYTAQAFRNGVSQLHGEVCQTLWAHLTDHPQGWFNPLPISSITNSVHVPFWQHPEWKQLLNSQSGEKKIDAIKPENIWNLHQKLKTAMLGFIKERMMIQQQRVDSLSHHDPYHENPFPFEQCFVLGFARRFAQYKRVTLILDDEERLFDFFLRMYRQYQTPILLLFAGKPHPDNYPGRNRIHQIYEASRRLKEFCQTHEIQAAMHFIEGYDVALARHLEAGCDIWLNNPVRPLEASGTSGMKAGINGVLNVSINDGWVPEGIKHAENGWIIGRESGSSNSEDRDDLFRVLEKEVLPCYFARSSQTETFSREWVKMMCTSIASISRFFNTDRMLCEYIEKMYLPAIRS